MLCPSIPSEDSVTVIVPPSMVTLFPLCIPSSAAVILIVPPLIYTKPNLLSSLFSLWIPSLDELIVIVPPAILTLSLPCRPCPLDLISIVPDAITRSSLLTTPCPDSVLIFSNPVPLMLRSSFEKITPSTVDELSEANSPVSVKVFSLFGASVRNTLSACFTYIAAVLLPETVAPLSTI